ncbi:hypothetical protein ACILDS_00415 [Capnocytophaga canis]|uniref:hypothetical protein n=1 Tax=Capnocytophaga canis TaxID=1848903 RepID=UPI001561ECC1|nr:hypothetical protein [Capnocytophaga canis]
MITFFDKNKGEFRVCEDSLTATVFDLLKYLPHEIFWDILKKSLFHQKLPEMSGEILEMNLWDRWSPKYTSNNRYVEPDVFIRFNDFDLLIEAKRYDIRQQNDTQIQNEIKAYRNEYEENKNLYFIQLGGLWNEDDTPNIDGVIMCKTNWSRILAQVVIERNKINNIDYSQINSYKRVLDDLIKGFAMHGYFKKLWLKDLEKVNITPNIPNIFKYANGN